MFTIVRDQLRHLSALYAVQAAVRMNAAPENVERSKVVLALGELQSAGGCSAHTIAEVSVVIDDTTF